MPKLRLLGLAVKIGTVAVISTVLGTLVNWLPETIEETINSAT